MCLHALCTWINDLGSDRLRTYEARKVEIFDWMADERRQLRGKGRLAALEGGTNDAAEDEIELTEEYLSTLGPEQLMAIVKNKMLKKLKGQGNGPRKCY